MENNRMSVADAAQVLGLHPCTVRLLVQTGELPIGRYIRRKGARRGQFLIYRDKVNQELGKSQ
jgi:hypothetical protein